MKQFLSLRRAVTLVAALTATLIAIPASSAGAATGTYVSTAGTTVLGLSIPVVSTLGTTLPVAVPLDFNVVSSTPLANLNIDPHMVH